MIRKTLMTPGPSPVPSLVREALGQEIMHHRTGEFQAVLKEVHAGLQDIFITKNPVLILASSGTGAMEAAVSNLFSKGDKVIGSRVRAKVVKNKVAPPFKQAEFDIMFDEGISRSSSIIDMGEETGVIKKSGTWLSFGEEKIGQGKENARMYLKENPKLMKQIEAEVRKVISSSS